MSSMVRDTYTATKRICAKDRATKYVGILNTKIVGIQYYRGHATNGEFVIIRREPSNPVCTVSDSLCLYTSSNSDMQYDHNAIRVDNVRREQIGHIPRQMAAKLARYMV